MAKRWKLDAVRDVLDVGCGVGHWGMLLASVMPDDVRVTGVDREPGWVEQARARAPARGARVSASRTSRARRQRLPFPDDSFDLTTCQTVLIHLPDPAAAIAEMLRVTRPGGLVAVAEPNNLTESLLLDSISNQASVDEIVELVRFQLTCERGKVALGEGDNSLGDRVPGLFVAQGLDGRRGARQRQGEPRSSRHMPRARSAPFADDARDRMARRLWNWSEADTRRLFLAGGGPRPTSPPTSRAGSPRARTSSAAWTTPPITASSAERSTSWRAERKRLASEPLAAC